MTYNYEWFKENKRGNVDKDQKELTSFILVKEFFKASGGKDAFTERTLFESLVLPREEDWSWLRSCDNINPATSEDFASLIQGKSIDDEATNFSNETPEDFHRVANNTWYYLPRFLDSNARKLLKSKPLFDSEALHGGYIVDWYNVPYEDRPRTVFFAYIFRSTYYEMVFKVVT